MTVENVLSYRFRKQHYVRRIICPKSLSKKIRPSLKVGTQLITHFDHSFLSPQAYFSRVANRLNNATKRNTNLLLRKSQISIFVATPGQPGRRGHFPFSTFLGKSLRPSVRFCEVVFPYRRDFFFRGRPTT